MNKLIIIVIIITIVIIIITIYMLKKSNEKFFTEATFSQHLDSRYGVRNLRLEDIHSTLRHLLKVFSEYCNENDIKPVIMHGTLIGYYFNKKILPWDDDIDIILVGNDAYKLKNHDGSNYIIEVNPNSRNRSKSDKNNVIDARIISKTNGVFIDITFFIGEDQLCAKDTHCYSSENILPLKPAIFEGSNVWIPNDIKTCLIQEYGQNVLKNTYKNWVFNGEWQLSTF